MPTNPFKNLGPQRFGFYHLLGQKAHEDFFKFIAKHQKDIKTVLEVGCGYFDYYAHYFLGKGITYTGWDIEQDIIDYRNSIDPDHKFILGDFKDYNQVEKYDLVFHHMVLSGLIGAEANIKILKATIKASKRFGYGVFWNTMNVDIKDLHYTLVGSGCKNIDIFYIDTGLHKESPQRQLIIHWEK